MASPNGTRNFFLNNSSATPTEQPLFTLQNFNAMLETIYTPRMNQHVIMDFSLLERSIFNAYCPQTVPPLRQDRSSVMREACRESSRNSRSRDFVEPRRYLVVIDGLECYLNFPPDEAQFRYVRTSAATRFIPEYVTITSEPANGH